MTVRTLSGCHDCVQSLSDGSVDHLPCKTGNVRQLSGCKQSDGVIIHVRDKDWPSSTQGKVAAILLAFASAGLGT